LFICALFNDAVSTSAYMASSRRMTSMYSIGKDVVAYLLRAGILWSEKTSVPSQWLCKRHVMTVTLTYTTTEELLETMFSMWSAGAAASLCKVAAARQCFFCAVLPEAISESPRPAVRSVQPFYSIYIWYMPKTWCLSRSLCWWHLYICHRAQRGLYPQKAPARTQYYCDVVWALELKN
jgi:hypothetical protein